LNASLLFRAVLAFAGACLYASTASAHGGDHIEPGANLWLEWNFAPSIIAGTLLVAWIYLRGMGRRAIIRNPPPIWRHLLFLAGLLATFIALQSPIDAMADRSFAIHQIQHIMLRMIAPMLLILSSPQAVLIAGLPDRMRKGLLSATVSNTYVQSVFRVMRSAAGAWAIFVLLLYFWQIPVMHDAAIENEALHYLMHATMLASGLLFFYVIFERHRVGISIPFGLRQLMLIGAIVSNILIGSLTTMKSMVLYSAYGDERLFGLHPLADEAVGGYIMWVPSSMMALIAILIVFHKWGKDEEQRYQRSREWTGSNSAALEFPQTAEELDLKVGHANRVTGFSLFLVSLTMLVGSLLTAILISIYG